MDVHVRVPRVVIAVPEAGVNIYHSEFQDPTAVLPSDIVDAGTGQPPIHVKLSTNGTYDERVRKDEALLSSLEPNKLYWFEGTRILGYSVEKPGQSKPHFLGDPFHGTGVVSAIRHVSKDAWIVMVEAVGDATVSITDPYPQATAALRWMADQPWIDIVSSSYGLPVDPPYVWEFFGFDKASQALVLAGKPFVNAAGNDPQPAFLGGTSGPPWVIAAGGVEPLTHGDYPDAARMTDVVSDDAQFLADWRSTDNYSYYSGTSFSAPRVAANMASALLQLRRDAGYSGGLNNGVLCPCFGKNITDRDVREALNVSATYWNTTDYDPTNIPSGDPLYPLFYATVPILPEPWLQMGWGYVGNETWRSMVAYLEGSVHITKPAEASNYMAIQQGIREAYWTLHA